MSDEYAPAPVEAQPKPAVSIPDDWQPGTPPTADGYPFAFIDLYAADDDRDVSKPVGHDEHGRPVYAPRGIRFRW